MQSDTKKGLLRLLMSIYASFFIAMLVALLCSASIWLEMRINLGYIFFGCWLVLFFIVRRGSLLFLQRGTILSLLLVVSICGIIHGTRSLFVIPAAFIREGLGNNSLSFSSINAGILIFLGIGLLGYSCLAIKKQSA